MKGIWTANGYIESGLRCNDGLGHIRGWCQMIDVGFFGCDVRWRTTACGAVLDLETVVSTAIEVKGFHSGF